MAAPRTSRSAATTFRPPIGASLPGAVVSLAVIALAGERRLPSPSSGESFASRAFCSGVAGASMRV